MKRLLDTEQLDELRIVLEDDYSAFITSFVTDTEKKLAQLHDLVAQNSAQQSRDLAHSLKGSCLNLGAIEMAEQCQRLQTANTKPDRECELQMLRSIWTDTKAEFG